MSQNKHNTGKGYIVVDGQVIGETRQCCHCNAHFESIKGSGVQRGFCLKCMAVTCGNLRCHTCLHFEQRLDLYEKGILGVL